jgi:hypothetical protein
VCDGCSRAATALHSFFSFCGCCPDLNFIANRGGLLAMMGGLAEAVCEARECVSEGVRCEQ